MGPELVRSLADELATAGRAAVPVIALSERHPCLDVDAAYAVQRALVERWIGEGAEVVGHKVGLTSLPMQRQLGVDQPDSGVLLDRMVLADGAVLDASRLIAPRVEAEIALVLGADLAAGAGRPEAERAVDAVAVAVEVIDSRIADWRIAIEDTIADNASSAYAVLGWPVPAGEVGDLRTVGLVLRRGGQVAATGAGAAVLGDPLRALLWLAERLARQGERLHAGQVVLPGAVHASVPLRAGDVVSAEGSGLGSVTFRCEAAA